MIDPSIELLIKDKTVAAMNNTPTTMAVFL